MVPLPPPSHADPLAPRMSEVPPVLATGRHYLVHVQSGGLFLVAVVGAEVSPSLVVGVLERLVLLLSAYTGPLTALALKDHFMAAHHVVDELLDGGLPANLEPNVVTELVRVPSLLARLGGAERVAQALPEGVLTATPWRRSPVAYTSNEIYLDVVEELHAIVDGVTGQVVPGSALVRGRVLLDCALSGTPDLLLKLAPSHLLEDVAFHPCVRLLRWQRERVVSFVPPDGRCVLMEYRIGGDLRLPLTVRPTFTLHEAGTGTLHVALLPAKVVPQDKPVEEVSVQVPLGPQVAATTVSSKTGTVTFDEATKLCTWALKTLTPPGGAQLDGSFTWSGERPAKPLLRVGWKVSGWAASGLKVDSLTLLHEKYNHFKGVKAVTLGHLDIRL